MHRICKFLGMILILGIVFFIICDEKGYKIGFENNQIIFDNKKEEKSDLLVEEEYPKEEIYKNSNLVYINYEFKIPKNLRKSKGIDPDFFKKPIIYKNSNRIKLYSGFENLIALRMSMGIDEKYFAELEQQKLNNQEKIYTGPNIIALNNNDTISSVFQGKDTKQDTGTVKEETRQKTGIVKQGIKQNTGIINEVRQNTGNNTVENGLNTKNNKEEKTRFNPSEDIKKKDVNIDLAKGTEIIPQKDKEIEKLDKNSYKVTRHSINISEGKLSEAVLPKTVLVDINDYKPNKHDLSLKKGEKIEHDFVVENNQAIEQTQKIIPDSLIENLLDDEEINIDTLESENDEFLQKVFEKTRDRDVMNLIVETYLNEYQFVKAKRFIENLPEMYRAELKPSLNLRVAFNSFALSSKNITENLNSLLQDYVTKGLIMDEDKNRYLGVLALMDRNYDKFFEIAAGFTSENHKAFASKLQGYKDQIAKQMGMPDYYFDTLVSLELFNQGLFQPAKVLALYSLQQNSNYILPHQVLAYANFLTNTRDTSIEYLKKLVDLDPNNAEKYRFLMGVASYRDEKYEQSVIMLSMIKDENLRLDTERYLINDYLKLDQKNKLISNWNKMLGYENLVASDFYTYFYETFFRPYSQGEEFQLYTLDTELANKMLRVCSMTLQNEEKAVCTYGTIGRNIALGQFDGMEQYLLNLVAEYPQGYLYQALGEYYVQHRELDKAKAYLLKAVSLSQKKSEINQIKKLLEETM